MADSNYYGPHVAMRGMEPAYRLWGKFDRAASGCWLWNAALHTGGYGIITINKKRLFAHRVMYELIVGPIPAGLHIDHLCRVRSCVNPMHLEPVTSAENTKRGQGNGAKTHCPQGHPYDESNTRTYTNQGGYTMRLCRACNLAAQRRLRERRKRTPV